MLIRKLRSCPKFISGDKVELREMLNANKEKFAFGYSLAHARLARGKATLAHRLRTSEVYYILRGTGKMYIDKESARVSAGDTVYIPPMSTQHIENTGKTALVFICIVDPAWKKQDEQILR